MARMVVIYQTPSDPEEFARHYFGVHIPLAKGLPGLQRYEVNAGPVVGMAAASDAYLVGTLHFASMEALRAAFVSECGKACAADRKLLAADDKVQMFLFDETVV